MTVATPIAVGIDLGTTISASAWVQANGRSAMIQNRQGDILTPSAVLFEDQAILVGKEALKARSTHPDRLAELVKRDMGSPFYSKPILGNQIPPEAIQACILRQLQDDAAQMLKAPFEVVITVPAYFDDKRRRATAEAGEMAGLKVLDIVSEPTAAALAFGEELGYLTPSGLAQNRMRIVVYDLGGGTFDVTLVELAPGDFRAIATDGDVRLGGHDWDQRLADYAAEQFIKMHRDDPRLDAKSLAMLLTEAEEAKINLSGQRTARMRVEHGGQVLDVDVTRDQFEELTRDLLRRTSHTTAQVLRTAGWKWNEVDKLLLVGGSTRMPLVRRMLQEQSGLNLEHAVHPDEAVARGAALYAQHLLSRRQVAEAAAAAKPAAPSQATRAAEINPADPPNMVKPPAASPPAAAPPPPLLSVTNVNAHSLGVQGIDVQNGRAKNVILIPRNSALPARKTKKFVTKVAGQKNLIVPVLEGESSVPSACLQVGRMVVPNLPLDLPQGSAVLVTFEYGENGRLSVRVQLPGSGLERRLELENESALSPEQTAKWRQVLASSGGLRQFGQAAAK
ncbi:MAG TPA: Hsp70 family protein [Pirellulales bacterium]|jgi:molecular chaperone DnaK|nr:Hsp70 family protein [Pirellulales bacterium]